jgi:hypothetical protein
VIHALRISPEKPGAPAISCGRRRIQSSVVEAGGQERQDAPEKSIRVENAFEAIVDPPLFAAGRKISDKILDPLASPISDLYNLFGRFGGVSEYRDQNAVADALSRWSKGYSFNRLSKIQLCPISEGRRGYVMLYANLP